MASKDENHTPRTEDIKGIRQRLRESEERYRTLVEQSPDNIVIHDLEGRILFTNASRVEVLGGKTPGDIIGRNAMEFVHPEDREFVHGAVTESLEDYKNNRFSIKTIEHRFVRLDGTVFHGEATGVPFIYNGELAMQVIVRDISRRKEAEESLSRAHEALESKVRERTSELSRAIDALSDSEARYRGLVETIPHGVQEIDTSGVITFANIAYARLEGYDRDELVGKSIFDLMPDGKYREKTRRYLAHLVADQPPQTPYFDAHITKDGNIIDVQVDWNYKRDEDGELVGFISIITDITERKRAEEEMKRLQAQLIQAQKMEAIGTLAGGVAHDFNNIMTVVKNLTSLALNMSAGDNRLLECLDPIRIVSDRAISLVQQLLIFSQNKPVRLSSIDLNDTVTDLMSMLRSLVSEDISIEEDLEYGLCMIEADRGRIEQVITNLVVNSRDAMPRGGEIFLRTENVNLDTEQAAKMAGASPGRFARITVEDTGIGMDPDTIAHIFEPFYTTKSPEGTGLGLSVVFGIIKELNGWVNVSSEPGHGTRFEIYVPAAARTERTATQKRAERRVPDGRGRRILLVEDDKWVRKTTAMMLSDNGYEVIEAPNAEMAISRFYREKGRFDLVMSDVVLPGKSGLQMLSPLLDIKPDTPVLLCSGHLDDKVQLDEIIKRGLAYIQKPYEIEDLLNAIEETMDRGGG